jgi:hypothetical protein
VGGLVAHPTHTAGRAQSAVLAGEGDEHVEPARVAVTAQEPLRGICWPLRRTCRASRGTGALRRSRQRRQRVGHRRVAADQLVLLAVAFDYVALAQRWRRTADSGLQARGRTGGSSSLRGSRGVPRRCDPLRPACACPVGAPEAFCARHAGQGRAHLRRDERDGLAPDRVRRRREPTPPRTWTRSSPAPRSGRGLSREAGGAIAPARDRGSCSPRPARYAGPEVEGTEALAASLLGPYVERVDDLAKHRRPGRSARPETAPATPPGAGGTPGADPAASPGGRRSRPSPPWRGTSTRRRQELDAPCGGELRERDAHLDRM